MHRRHFLKSGLPFGLALASIGQESIAARRGFLRLNANENPLGLSEGARDAIRKGLPESNRYPFLQQGEFEERLAEHHGVGPEAVLSGNGSSEILRLAVQALAENGPVVLTAEPTYEAVSGLAGRLSVEVRRFPLRKDFAHDLEAMSRAARGTPGPSLLYLCNPNNPTGTITPAREIEALLKELPERATLVIDEAYHHYAESPEYASFLEGAIVRRNLLVVRTFSKVYAMAGLRLGYGVAHPDLMGRLRSLTRLNVNQAALLAGEACFEDATFLSKSLAGNREAKKILLETLDRLELPFLPSEANFVMFRVGNDTREFARQMRGEGILVGRPFPPLLEYNRVSLGLPSEMESFCRTLRQFRSRGWI